MSKTLYIIKVDVLHLFVFISGILIFSCCKESRRDRMARMLIEWNERSILFPDSMLLTSYRDDTIIKYTRTQTPYTILNYVDTTGCIGCKLQLPRWKGMMEELDSLYPSKVTCLMVFYPKEKDYLVSLLRNSNFNSFVYIDEKDTLNRLNSFLNEEHFRTFLLDKNDKVLAIGNPIFNPKIKELYKNIISGKMVSSSEDKQPQTTVSFSRDKMDLGRFSWEEEKNTEFVISNVGNVPFVINDVVTSCGCTTVDYAKEPVRPGEDARLKVKYRAEHPEYFDKTITVYCNASGSPFRLRLTGNAE